MVKTVYSYIGVSLDRTLKLFVPGLRTPNETRGVTGPDHPCCIVEIYMQRHTRRKLRFLRNNKKLPRATAAFSAFRGPIEILLISRIITVYTLSRADYLEHKLRQIIQRFARAGEALYLIRIV